MVKLAVDLMGSDNGPEAIAAGIKEFLKKHSDVEIYACGSEEALALLKDEKHIHSFVTSQVVPMESGAMQAMRMKDSSMMKVFNLFAEENVQAGVSAGSTGGFLSLATLKLKLIPGVERAALTSPFPTLNGSPLVVLDIGASNENNPQQEALKGDADVLVSEGYPGNIFLKSSEGVAKMMSALIKKAFHKNIFTIIGYLFSAGGFKDMKKSMDYKSYGGAILLGVNGVVVKAHGNSDAYSFSCALEVAYKMTSHDIVNKIKEGFQDEL